jgi:enoyl-CoA hydratase
MSHAEFLLKQLHDNGILSITINRPEKLNALNKEIIQQLHQALSEASANEAVRVIILTGAGSKAFVAGADIAEFASFSVEEGKNLSAEGHRMLFNFIENMNKPVIAAINGFALGGGFELALSCHVRIAAKSARVGFPEVNLGVIPGYGGTQRLAQLAGKGIAFEMILSAEMIKADKALELNLVNHVVDDEQLMTKALELAGIMSSKSPNALKRAIKAINALQPNDAHGFSEEVNQFGLCFGTPDFIEGTTAFMEKRKAAFQIGVID